jgi:C4-dicarboxylate transporter DctM subunit
MIPAMVNKGYAKPFAAGLTASGGTLGILIPPSNPMIIYGVVGNVSITSLFIAGFIPGIIVGFGLMLVVYFVARRREYSGSEESYTLSQISSVVWNSKWALCAPVIILGGIYGGIFTPTEASVIAVIYAFFVGFFINRELSFVQIFESFKETIRIVGSFLLIIGTATLFGRFLALYQVPTKVAMLISSVSDNWIIVLMLINLLLLFLGMFMDTFATIIILTPILLPLVTKLGVDPIHFGIIIVLTSEIGFLTPPLGVNLFVACSLTNLSLEKLAKACLPFIVVFLLSVILITCLPQISMFLPNLIKF